MLRRVRVCKGYRFRVYPTPVQEARLRTWESALRFLWNIANEQRRAGYGRSKDERRYPTAFDQINELTDLRADLPWLADVPRNVCAQALVELDKAWQRCFKKLARAPRWKRKGDGIGLCEPHPKTWRLDESGLRFPKLGPMRIVQHRPWVGTPKTCTLRRDGDQWFASIVCESEIALPEHRTEPRVALDRGVVNLVADSDGRLVENPRFYEQATRRLAHASRVVSRRKKGSQNREKAKARVARLHRKVRRQREHVLHYLSSTYAKSHGTVAVEKLQTKNMVRVGGGLARSIGAAGWGRLIEMLRYKLAWAGGNLVEVSAAYSSQECFACEHVSAKSRKTQAEFVCVACGVREHADLNAARVLLRRANRSVLPVEGLLLEGSLRSRKRLRVVRRSSESSVLRTELITARTLLDAPSPRG